MVKVLQGISNNKITQKSILAIGNFDGFHIGHQSIIKAGKQIAKKNKKKFGILTFNPLPYEYFTKNYNYKLISNNEKINLAAKLGLDYIIFLNFNKNLRNSSPQDFISKILLKKINMSHIIVGKEFRFGKKRKGNVNFLKKTLKPLNIKVTGAEIVNRYDGKISSSKIRKKIMQGKVLEVKKSLNRFWSVKEKVLQGRKVGRKIGYRTANIELKNRLNPKVGVYAVKILFQKKVYKGIANFGYAPTFKRKKLVLECFIFNQINNLYGKVIEVQFIKFIRGEKKFMSIEMLKKQIKYDIDKTRRILKNV